MSTFDSHAKQFHERDGYRYVEAAVYGKGSVHFYIGSRDQGTSADLTPEDARKFAEHILQLVSEQS